MARMLLRLRPVAARTASFTAPERLQTPQKLRVLSPLRPHTTMAIEKEKVAARAAQPRVISIANKTTVAALYSAHGTRLGGC